VPWAALLSFACSKQVNDRYGEQQDEGVGTQGGAANQGPCMWFVA
jgi:hypothetical protein